jgi:SAM-dependent methyltransferase
MLRTIYDKLPPRLRLALKGLLARNGHGKHFLDGFEARRLAKTKKRLAVVAPKIGRRLALAEIKTLVGKRCMEFGCGMVPTELVCYWMMGARQLVAVDYNRIARLKLLPRHEGFHPSMIDYRAPIDMSLANIPGFDFIHSESVLEHISPQDVPAVLRNLAASLEPGGLMIHSIDLRDHLDPTNAPYSFLTDPAYNPSYDFDARGNRLRRSEWIAEFDALGGISTTYHHEVATPGRPIPQDFADNRALFLVTVSKRN